MKKNWHIILPFSLTGLLLSLVLIFPYGRDGHHSILYLFALVIVLTAFIAHKIMIPMVILFVIGHMIIDGTTHGHLPVETLLESLFQLLIATVLYFFIRERVREKKEKNHIIKNVQYGLAKLKGIRNQDKVFVDAVFYHVNDNFAKLFNQDKHEITTLKLSTFCDDIKQNKYMFSEVIKSINSFEPIDCDMYLEHVNKYFNISILRPVKNEISLFVQDITAYKKNHQKIQFLSQHDALTGFYSRTHLMDRFEYILQNIKNKLGVVIFDIDNLKLLNNHFNAEAGDQAIKMAATVIKAHADEDWECFRYGGDEFVVLTRDINADVLLKYAKDVESDFSGKAVHDVSITLSSGMALKSKEDDDLSAIFIEAENDLYNRKTISMNSSHIFILKMLLEFLTQKFNYEKVHSEVVSELSLQLGQTLGLNHLELEELTVASMFHDIGKIAIPDSILDKPGKLTFDEYEIIKKHPEIGYKIIQTATPFSKLSKYILYHHEHFDGKGYPKGLEKDDIPLISRIIAVVDAYEAMTSNRSYRQALSQDEAIEELNRHAGTQFDPIITETFIHSVLKKKVTAHEKA